MIREKKRAVKKGEKGQAGVSTGEGGGGRSFTGRREGRNAFRRGEKIDRSGEKEKKKKASANKTEPGKKEIPRKHSYSVRGGRGGKEKFGCPFSKNKKRGKNYGRKSPGGGVDTPSLVKPVFLSSTGKGGCCCSS